MSDPQGLPDVQGLAEFVQQDSEPQEKVQTPQPDKAAVAATPQQTEAKPQEVDWAQFKNKDGSLNHEALLKSYKEIQGAYTKTTQERKALQDQFENFQRQIQEQVELQRLAAIPRQQTPAQPDFDTQFIQDPQGAVKGVVEQQVKAGIVQAQIEGVLAGEQAKDPDSFQERYSYAMRVRNQFPYLTQSALGVTKLFQLADEVRKTDLIKQSHRAVRLIFGEDADLEKLKALAKKSPDSPFNQSLAYMPDTSSSTRSGAELGVPKGRDAEIQDSVAKGDVDSVIKNVFRQALER